MRYYYIVLKDTSTAVCFHSIKNAKSQAIENKSLIYFSKNELPDFIKEVKGFCNESKKTPSGKFTSSLTADKFKDEGE